MFINTQKAEQMFQMKCCTLR